MILFTIMAAALIFIVISIVLVAIASGAGMIVIFGDVIICAALIIFICKALLKKRG